MVVEEFDDEEEYPQPKAPGFANAREFYDHRDHWERTTDNIMTRWSNEVERVYGDFSINSYGSIHIHYEYDRYDDGKDWYLPVECFWDLDGEIEKAKAEKAEKERLEAERLERAKAANTAAHERYIRAEAAKLGLLNNTP